MKIYIAHPITGSTPKQVIGYFTYMVRALSTLGFTVLQPMTGKGYFRTQKDAFQPAGYKNPVSTNHAIFQRDQWMVRQADIVLVDFTDSTEKSAGCLMELAWAAAFNKHTIVVLPEGDPHTHAFVLEAADIVFTSRLAALNYLKDLAKGKT